MTSLTLTERSWCLAVPHHSRGASLARHRLGDELAGAVQDYLFTDVITVAAELLSNAIRHARPLPGGMVRLSWRLFGSADRKLVEVRVTDGGSDSEPTIRAAEPRALNGRGLAIVSILASRWGVDRDGLGQSVWAECR